MEKINHINDLKKIDRAVTFGKFDGVHLGHRKLMEKIIEQKNNGLVSTVFTFDTQPQNFLVKSNSDNQFSNETDKPVSNLKFKTIFSKSEKENIFRQLGIDCLFEYQVTKENLSVPAEKFVTDVICDKLNAKYIAVGEDFCFGHNRKGNVSLLEKMSKQCGYTLEIVEKERFNGDVISSSRIKKCLTDGNIEEVNDLLGCTYNISGQIVKGNQLGRTWNIPTINVPWNEEKLEAAYGVYFSKVIIEGKEYFGMTNFGRKPSIEGEYLPGSETYLYNCDEDLYGKTAKIYLLHFKRCERKFENIESLKQALYKDIEDGKKYFNCEAVDKS